MYKTCVICNKEFHIPPCRKDTAKTCSQKCSGKYKTSLKKLTKINCGWCGVVFEQYPSLINKTGRSYCSKDCSNKGRTIHNYKCENCNKHFHGCGGNKNRFCSIQCTKEGRKEERNPKNCECKQCGKQFHKSDYAIKKGEGIYCSNICKSKWQTGHYKTGKPSHYYSNTHWFNIRKQVLKRDRNTCHSCKGSFKTKDLQVNHIKFRQLGGSDALENLETLCRVCHGVTDAIRLKELLGDDKARMRDYKFKDGTITKK